MLVLTPDAHYTELPTAMSKRFVYQSPLRPALKRCSLLDHGFCDGSPSVKYNLVDM